MINKAFSVLLLVPTVFSGISNFSAEAAIPQGSFQEIYIEGYSNEVNQQLNQTLNINFIDFSGMEDSVIPNFNIQGSFLDNPNNEVNQAINQNVLDLGLVPLNLSNFSTSDFIGNDNVLNGVQFAEQQVFIQGDNNYADQQSSQSLTNSFLWEPLTEIEELADFKQFLSELLNSKELDSLQFSSQDTVLFGNNNIVNQNITQTLDILIFSELDLDLLFATEILGEDDFLNPTQFTIQETFISDGGGNFITRNINQSIKQISMVESSIFLDESYSFPVFPNTSTEENNLIDFPIDSFINEVLNNTIIEAEQINSQFIEIIGDSNENTQQNEQVLDLITDQESSDFSANEQESVVSVPESSNLKVILLLPIIIAIKSIAIRND
ncbi:hypothetical protein [Crocosphaera sp. Alani8]|uniref:hypothetical protein n=1 Tax=Crocosphaera sp. Alani8 TaxID=3038952 RepID=UPI00313D4BAA